MKKKLFAIFGPIVVAFGLLAVFFTSPYRLDTYNPEVIKRASASMSESVLEGDVIKNRALAEKEYVPFFGSSELSRISPLHPTPLAEKYKRGYTPFLLGAPGTQSLILSMMMGSTGEILKNKKVIVVLSPQWFGKNGLSANSFDKRSSELQIYDWLFSLKKITSADRYFVKRLLDYPKINTNISLKTILENIEKGLTPSAESLSYQKLQWNMLKREDEIFSNIGIENKQKIIDQSVDLLPNEYQEKTLIQLANEIGKKETSNNPYGLKNSNFNGLKGHLEKLKDSDKNQDYRFSPEFSDFQLILDQLAKNHSEALFIIPPVNGKWHNYTKLSHPMMQEFAKKIKYQLNSQGFNHIADFTDQADTDYFMEDAIHLGWRGWLAADQAIRPFLEDEQKPSTYKMDSSFYSKDWQQLEPSKLK
ncbi:DltD protein [Enterococcus faecalis 13-SD-W-01]|nr:DltD protein [Enterococcus faecalis 13-SD-W-01]